MSEKPYLAMTGISRKGESKLNIRTIQNPIPSGTYTAAYFAKQWPEQYTALRLVGMPHAVHSLITITGR